MPYRYFKPNDLPQQIDTCFEIGATEDAPTIHDLILPDCTPGLMCIAAGVLHRSEGGRQTALRAGAFYLFGQKTRAVEYRFEAGQLHAYGVKLKPDSIYTLFGIPANEITDRVIDVRDALDKAPSISCDINERHARLISWLQSCIGHASPAVLDVVLSDIHRAKGDISIATLAERYGLGYKGMQRLFRKHVGVTPKLYTRIVRFGHSVALGMNATMSRLTDVAYQSGYFDQMHFIKESKYFTGQVPSRLFGKAASPVDRVQLAYLRQRGY